MVARSSRVAWVLLVVMSAGWTLNQVVGAIAFAGDVSPLVFGLLAVVCAAATVVLLVPYRHRAGWAWGMVWVEVAAIGSVALWARPEIGVWYAGSALVMAACQLVTLREFRAMSGTVRAPRAG